MEKIILDTIIIPYPMNLYPLQYLSVLESRLHVMQNILQQEWLSFQLGSATEALTEAIWYKFYQKSL